MTATSIPEGRLAQELHLACEASRWREIENRLRGDAPNESCVFVLTEQSRGDMRTTLILREAIWPRPGEVKATPYRLEISADYISRAMDSAVITPGSGGRESGSLCRAPG